MRVKSSRSARRHVARGAGKKFASKAFGAANMVFSVIPDTVKIIGNIVDNSAPIIDKELQRRHEQKMALIELPNVIDMSVLDAQEHLKTRGFTVHMLTAKPHAKYAKAFPGEVVAMSPRSGKFKAGHLIKLYYVDQDGIQASQTLLTEKEIRAGELGQSVSQALKGAKNLLKKDNKR